MPPARADSDDDVCCSHSPHTSCSSGCSVLKTVQAQASPPSAWLAASLVWAWTACTLPTWGSPCSPGWPSSTPERIVADDVPVASVWTLFTIALLVNSFFFFWSFHLLLLLPTLCSPPLLVLIALLDWPALTPPGINPRCTSGMPPAGLLVKLPAIHHLACSPASHSYISFKVLIQYAVGWASCLTAWVLEHVQQ